jgi:FAD/FMN-containing dehydrogenase
VRTSPTEHADLFWAVRGGGGNFGVVSSFEFKLHAVGPMVTGGLCAWPLSSAHGVLKFFREYTKSIDDDVFTACALLTGPDGATKLVGIAAGYMGDPGGAEKAVAPIKAFGTPVLDAMGPIPYVALNGMLDAAFPKGALNYWKAPFLDQLSDRAIDAAVGAMSTCPSPMSQILFEHFHGAATRVATDATAYALRSPGFNVNILGEWLDGSETEANIKWVRDTYAALQPAASGRRYANYIGTEDMTSEGLSAVYGSNLPRLREIKKKYDPENVFRENLNIA